MRRERDPESDEEIHPQQVIPAAVVRRHADLSNKSRNQRPGAHSPVTGYSDSSLEESRNDDSYQAIGARQLKPAVYQ